MNNKMAGTKIEIKNGKLIVPDEPIIPVITGDGIGRDIVPVAKKIIDAAVQKIYKGKRKIAWMDVLAGEEAFKKTGSHLPKETLEAIKKYVVAIKGPLTTPVGGGIRSVNVELRQKLDLYSCVRPVRYFSGVPSPMKNPEKLDVVIFRENTEDVYAGYEWKMNSPEAKELIETLNSRYKTSIRKDSGIGIKPISEFGSKRLVRAAIKYALENGRRSVTLVHKGNIMKFTEGAFKEGGYEVAKQEFRDKIVTEEEVAAGADASGKIIINDRIADNMFQQILIRPEEYDLIATTNLNGDYLSDACAAQVGGLGIAPGANIGDSAAVFEATHGTAPKYAGLDKANPGSIILSGVMMLEFIGWKEAADAIVHAFEKTIKQKTVTYDFAREMKDAKELKCSEFGDAIVGNLGA